MANFRTTAKNFTHIAVPYFRGEDAGPDASC